MEGKIAMDKIKYKIIAVSAAIVVLAAAVITGIILQIRGNSAWDDISVNQLEDIKIYVRFVNSKRIYIDTFFPLDTSTIISDDYILQVKDGNDWSTIGTDTDSKLEYGTADNSSIDDEKYPEIGYNSHQHEFIKDYGILDKGSYRIVFGAKRKKTEYYLAVPFDITLDYEYQKEPEEYEYTVTTNWGQGELAEYYEQCHDYITYSEFPLGFENQTFSMDLYKHLKKAVLASGKTKQEISGTKELKKLYQYFAGAVMTRTDGGIYGATFFTDADLLYKTMEPPQKTEETGQSYGLTLTFGYNGTKKEIRCNISGHRLVVETSDFAFREQISERFPLGELIPAKEKKKLNMEFYVFNKIGKAMEGMK